MAKFDIEKAMEIAQSGDEERIRRLFEGIQERLNCKRYGLVWERGGENEDSGFEAENVVLDYKAGIPYPKLRADLSTYPERADGNMLLEGDNYIWLKILEQTHAGKIDVIYIDPPYNTGKNDFKYNDRFVDLEDTFRHSKWLDVMERRLLIAQKLLATTGILLISCDDREQATVKLLCDQVFGSENFLLNVVVNRPSETATNYTVSKHEYMLVYVKDINRFSDMERHEERFVVSRGTVGNENQTQPVIEFPAGLKCYGIEDGTYNETRKIEGSRENITNLDPIVVENGQLKYPVRMTARWRSSNDMRNFFANDCKPTKAKIAGTMVEIYFENDRFNPQLKKTVPNKLSSIYLDNVKGSTALTHMDLAFSYPKSPKLLLDIFKQLNLPLNALVLDFFAGSGTTMQAVEELNQEDGGHRKWILVTNNEDQDEDDGNPETGICRDITKPRLDTIITGQTVKGNEYSKGTDSGYQYFQYDFIKRDRNLYERNADRFFKPYIVDALIPIKHGVARTLQDGTRKLCVYESSTKKVIALFANTEPEDVQAIVDEYFADDDREHILLLPEETSAYKAILKAQVKNGVDVQYHHNLISTADYLE